MKLIFHSRLRILLSILLLLIIGAFAFSTKFSESDDKTVDVSSVSEFIPVSLKIHNGEQWVVQQVIDMPLNSTALDLLNKTGLSIQTKEYSFGTMIEGIDGTGPSSDSFWGFYVNGSLATVGVSSYRIQSNDVVELRYEKME